MMRSCFIDVLDLVGTADPAEGLNNCGDDCLQLTERLENLV